MKSYVRAKSLVMAFVFAIAALALAGWTRAWGFERSAQTQANQQVLVERFDKIMELARLQHFRIQEWHKRAQAQDKHNKTVLKSKKVVAMQ